MFRTAMTIGGFDPELDTALKDERQRQEDHIELIASENYASPRVLEAQGSVLTNKYAEGYPGKRYYGGCEFVDVAEQLAIDRAKKLFGADYANVQPHSGSQANAAAYLALINPGDTILGMSLDHGGHLTHGAKVNFSGKLFRAVQYGIRPDNGEIDYDALAAQALAEKPKMIVAGFSAYSRYPRLQALPRDRRFGRRLSVRRHGACRGPRGRGPVPESDSVRRRRHDHHAQDAARSARRHDPRARQRRDHQEAQLAGVPRHAGRPADARHRREGGGASSKRCSRSSRTTRSRWWRTRARCARACRSATTRSSRGGTDNHLFLLDLSDKAITGKEADAALGKAHITVNKNAVPNDPRPPMVTSGIRIGSPAGTTRGFKEREFEQIADLDRRRARRQWQRRGHREDARGGDGAVPPLSGLRPLMQGRATGCVARGRAMHCPFCAHPETKVNDSRLAAEGAQIRRRRECLQCGERFTTFETAELVMPLVVKSDQRRVPFDESKLRGGLPKALEKRPVSARIDRRSRRAHHAQVAQPRRARSDLAADRRNRHGRTAQAR